MIYDQFRCGQKQQAPGPAGMSVSIGHADLGKGLARNCGGDAMWKTLSIAFVIRKNRTGWSVTARFHF